MATSRHRLPWIQMFLCVSALVGMSLAISTTENPETTVPLTTTTVIASTAAPVSDSTVANNEVDMSVLTGSHDNHMDTSSTSHSPKSDNPPVTTVTKAPPEVFTVTIPAPKTRSRQPSTEPQTRAVREVTMVSDVSTETVTRDTKVITRGISTVTMDTTSTTRHSYDDESDKIINPTTLIIMDPTSAVAMETSEESLITSSVSLEADVGNLDLSTHLYDNELSTLSRVTMETDREILGTSPEDVTTVTISDELTTHSLSSTDDQSVTTETEYSSTSFYVTTETATQDQYFYGNRSTADYNSNEVCTITTLTHNPGSRTDTTLTFSWAVDDQGCTSLEICISPAPTSSACQDVTTVTTVEFTDLTPGTTHTATLTATATDGVTNSSTATGLTALSPPTNVALQRGSPSQSVVRVTWSEPAGEYENVRVDCVNDTDNNISDTVTKGVTTYNCTGLTAGTLYTVTVTTTQTGNHDVSAGTKQIYTGLNPPTAVTVSPSPGDMSTSLTVNWAAPVGGYTHVTGRCDGVTGGTNVTFIATSGVTSMNCTGLTPGGVYEVTLTASISSSDPAPPPDSTATAPQQAITVPLPPAQTTVSDRTNSSLSVTVSRPVTFTLLDDYRVTYTTAAVTHNITVTADYNNVTVVTVVPGLVAGTTYDITSAACSQGECSEEMVAGGDTTTLLNPPNGITLGTVDSETIQVNWVNPAGYFDYITIYCESVDPNANPSVVNVSDGSETGSCDDLTPGGQYEVTVGSSLYDLDLAPQENSTDVKSAVTVPLKPGKVEVLDRTTSSLNVSISRPTSATILDRYQLSSGHGHPEVNVTATFGAATVTRSLSPLEAGTTYHITVVTCSRSQCSTDNVTDQQTTLLNPPTQLAFSTITETTLEVTWENPVGNFDTVTVYCLGRQSAVTVTVVYSGDETSGVCGGLTPGGLYDVVLGAALVDTSLAPAVNSTTKATITVPSPPTVQITTQTTTSLTVSVARGPGQCSGFHVYYSSRRPDGGDGGMETLACSDGSPQQVVLSSLLTNAQYNVSASVISNTDGTLEAIEGNNATTDAWTKPARPQTPTLDNVGPRWLLVEWTAAANNPDNVAYYDVRVTTNEDSPRADCYRVKGPASDLVDLKAISCTCNNTVITLPDPAFSLNVSGVTPYTAHTVTVTTVNPGVCSETSTALTTTTDEDFPGAPANVTVLPYPTYLELSWSPPPEPNGVIVSYEVRWCDTGAVPTRAQDCFSDVVNTTTEYRVEGLIPFKCYNVTVAASTSVGQGPALQGFEDGVSKDPCTKAGIPQFLAQTTASAQSAFTISVSWSLVEGAVPTGNVTYYNVTATSGTAPSTHTRVKGFNTSSAVLSGLEPYELYIVCVIAQTENQNGEILQIKTPEPDHCTPTRTSDWYPTKVSSFAVQNGQNAQECHTFSLTWSEPADTNGVLQQYVVTYRKTSDPPGTERTENFEGTKLEGQIDCIDPNDAEYAFKIQAANDNYRGNVTEMSASSGICPPSSVTKPGFSKDNVARSQSTVTVPIDRCSLCYNNNGDVSFVAVIVTAGTINTDSSEEYTRANFDQVFKSVESHNESVGYRATPDDFKESVNCTGYREMCRQADPTAPCTSARATRAANEVPPYDFVIGDKLGCDSGQYCNKPLKDGTKYRVRVAAEVNGKVNVSPSSVDVVTDANMAWVAGVVIALLVVIAAVVVGVIFMKKRKQGPFREKHQQTRPVRPTDMGSINPGFAGIDEPLIERFPAGSMDSLDSVFTDHRPRPVPVSSFLAHFEEHARDSDLLFAEEYKLIQELSPKHSVDASEHPSNRLKNRFTNILPFDHSRVKLLPADDDDCSDYINANYMPGYNSKREFIASQGPMKSTTEDYWRMVWEQNVAMIVMVTQLEERGRERCAKYWPNDNEPMYYGDLQVQMRSESVLDAYVIRILDIRLGEIERTLKQMHFIKWPDFGVPDRPEMLVDFVCDMRMHYPRAHRGPILVHCSAGVGRTGSFIAVDRLLQHIKENQTIDIFGIVLEMRNNRSFMIQVEAQYVLVHKCVVKALERGLHRQRPFNQPEPDDDQAIYANQNYLPEDNENIYENAQMAEHGV